MDKETTDKMYAFTRMLKEQKPFATLSNTKANHWIEVLNLFLDKKVEKTMDKLNGEGHSRRFETIAETMTLKEFDERINKNKIKTIHIVGTRLLDGGKIEVVYTKLIKEEDEVDEE